MANGTTYEVIIIGGSYAGLSAAMALGRSIRNILVIDSGQPCNKQTPHSHNFLTQDGAKPGMIAGQGKNEILKYETVRFIHGTVIKGNKEENGFSIELQTGEVFKAKKLLFTTGVK